MSIPRTLAMPKCSSKEETLQYIENAMQTWLVGKLDKTTNGQQVI